MTEQIPFRQICMKVSGHEKRTRFDEEVAIEGTQKSGKNQLPTKQDRPRMMISDVAETQRNGIPIDEIDLKPFRQKQEVIAQNRVAERSHVLGIFPSQSILDSLVAPM